MNKKALWLRLKNYHFEHIVPTHLFDRVKEMFGGTDASTKAFASKIARKLGWTNDFALLAIAEYKKFVFLGVVSEFSVTPSKIIDQVWHEHILFSKAYREFCSSVLGQNFDHNPELVPAADQTGIFNAQYLDTLDLYKAEFNAEPPAAIWGMPKFDTSRAARGYQSARKEHQSDSGDAPVYWNEPALWLSLDSSQHPSDHGKGALHHAHASHEHAVVAEAPASSHDTGSHDGGGDVGGSDTGGGSSCSSSCGGGGGGD